MNLFKLLLLFLIISTSAFSQTTLTGNLIDKESNQPIEFATVYLNGTSIGTISDSSGFFILKNIPLPCKVVVSHINYETMTAEYPVTKVQKLVLNLQLNPKQNKISEVVVNNRNMRKKNLRYFNKTFFGKDKYGDYAFLENDGVLFFTSIKDERPSQYHLKELRPPEEFKAEAAAPLEVKLPLLGYDLYIDLTEFSVNRLNNQDLHETRCLGYTYFIPTQVNSEYKKKKIEEHRLHAYYNSRLHFFRAQFANQLKLNGYLTTIKTLNLKSFEFEYEEFDLNKYVIRNEDVVEIVGLKDKFFYVLYYQNLKGKPIDINTKRKHAHPIVSSMSFKKDTCIILSNGRVPDMSIVFGPKIGDKKVGSWLPDDYWPE
ncbi:MAG: carboxypeptidase-like regulatory domain-containing protein [Prolixibacteraceae bacterium]|nr:carboxypeptidase-like regulatory domain-containing protein [Prolixibacteraceae bacterium]